mgnify:CR=1 FL=1
MNTSNLKKNCITYAAILVLAVGLSVGGWHLAVADHINPEQLKEFTGFLELMSKYIGINEQMYEIASSNDRTACFAVFQLKELFEKSGRLGELPKVYREMLNTAKSPAVRNLIRLQLSDNLKDTGNANEAIEVLRELITETSK